ncbi:DUF2240 family protein [Halocatena halophila]|uniref:DUF2240 family protein n=1 Tax=Halocatena halophila TaxID=2814576 RepID=UPI002ED301BA
MSLSITVGAPFHAAGRDRLGESEFVVALSLDRDWFSPDQAKRLIDVAIVDGLLERDGDTLTLTFDPEPVPDSFSPDESILRQRTTFERVLDRLTTEADSSKREIVAAINELQATLGVTTDAAAVLYAHRNGHDIEELAAGVRSELTHELTGE